MGEQKTEKVDASEFSAVPFLAVFLFPLVFFVSFIFRGWWSAAGVIFVFVCVPFFDVLLGKDNSNPTKEQVKILDGQLKFRIITWLWVPLQLAVLILSIHLTSDDSVPTWQRVNWAMSAGMLGGAMGLNVAHELNHKRNKFEKFLAHVLFTSVGYDHFAYEHNLGHHWNVATPRDPATALLGENLWAFLPRTLVGGVTSVWKIEKDILAKRGRSAFHPSNRVLRGWISEFAILCVCGYIWGLHGAAMFVGQCATAIILLEATNYIEHYGLMREQNPDGTYEPVDPLHSWNAAERLTNYMLFKLQRHSDHHTYPYKRYQSLISHGQSAQMPTGYAGMILIALIPPIWFRVMNPRVLELRQRLKEQKKAQQQLAMQADGADIVAAKPIKGN